MENPVQVHFHCNAEGQIALSLGCPGCGQSQALPISAVRTGLGFVCPCGEEIPLHAEALAPVAQELQELRHLIERTITLAV